ncbi:uncharacterized protein SAMN05421686_10617 [Thalassolituus maritimus]|uniref:TPM domain-containing protein n=1 Tax=Thalassolituus maritimus TaxID=484498 RepID=A0A1N7MVX7_9GAMM|nr:uncharacterized protein SAMN05421686_10617 [Thalassolituus maritimus]
MRVNVIRSITATVLLMLCAQTFAAIEFPSLTGRVVDNASMLPVSSERSIEKILKAHEEATSNQVVVVTIDSLKGYSIEEYGYQLGRHWGIGQKDKNNGVLLIVAKNDRKVRIEVGYGLEGNLTDAIAGHIIRTKITPDFKRGRFTAGISKGVDSILLAIDGAYKADKSKLNGKQSDFITILFVVLILFIFIANFFDTGGPGGFSSGRYTTGGFGGGFGSGGFGGGGGFSGGGGGFGGGGASGGW